jgi:uncharacterized membrane protein YdjX (TVP38/TMEM64 family)
MFSPKLQKIIFIVFLTIVIGSLIIFHISGYDLDSKQIGQYLKTFGIWVPFIFIVTYIFGAIFIPSSPFKLVAGFLFGFKLGLLYIIIGGIISSIITFRTSRKLGKEWAEKILEHKYLTHLNEYNKKIETGAVWDIVIFRLMPIMPLNMLSILLGISKVNEKDYITGTALGFLPSAVLTVYLGTLITKIF